MDKDLINKINYHMNDKTGTRNQHLCIHDFNIIIKTAKGLYALNPLLEQTKNTEYLQDFAEINFLDKLS